MLEEKNLYEENNEKNKKIYILLIFDNIDRLPKDITRIFEKRLIDLVSHN